MTLPDTRVYLDDGTGSFPYDITAFCLLANGLSIKRGREDWQGAVTAGELNSLTLNNSDGRFTPGSTLIASPSPIKVDQRIRVKETINGITLNRHTGYVKSWPVAWPWTVSTLSTVAITAVDAQARAERRPLKSIIEEEILYNTPTALYTLGEPVGALSAPDSSGNQAPALAMAGSGAAVVFGTDAGPGTDGLTAATFAGGQYLTAAIPSPPASWSFGFFFATTLADATTYTIAALTTATNVTITSGTVAVGLVSYTAGLNDGAVHHVGLTYDNPTTTLTVYIDGNTVGTQGSTPSPTRISIGGAATAAVGFTGSIAHAFLDDVALVVPRMTLISTAGRTGFAGESGTDRIARLAAYTGIPLGTLDASLTNVAFTDITDRPAWEAIQQVADAEMGLAFIDGSGSTAFHNRNRVAAKTTPDLTLDRQYITPDVQAVTDEQQLANYLDVTSETTQVTQTVRDATSETSHGRYADSKSYLVQTDQEALDRANWLLYTQKEPGVRYGTLTINLYKMTPAMAQLVLSAIEPNCWLRITSMPSQTPGGTTGNVIVQGFTENQGGNTWELVCNVTDKATYYPSAWILDSTTFSVLDSTTRVFV